MSVKQRIFFNIASIMLLGLLPGCALGPKIFKTSYTSYNHPDLLNEYQARFVDIPFPFDGQIKSDAIHKDFVLELEQAKNWSYEDVAYTNRQIIIVCITTMLPSDLCAFFHNEMEQLGWRERALFVESVPNFTAVFEKPGNKLCIISVKSLHKSTQKKSIIHYYLA